jgi:hypothetical protein
MPATDERFSALETSPTRESCVRTRFRATECTLIAGETELIAAVPVGRSARYLRRMNALRAGRVTGP